MALAPSSDLRLFGIDLGRWRQQWHAATALLLAHPALRALTPSVSVRLHQASGQRTWWRMAQDDAYPITAPANQQPQVNAIELSTQDVLERSLTLPALPPADLAQAVQLEVAALTPFKPEQTVFGYRVQPATADRVRVDLALTSRQHMDVLLLQHARISRPEVWVLPANGASGAGDGALHPICMPVVGNRVRQRLVRHGRRLRLLLLGLAGLLLLALAVTPTMQLRQRALAAQSALAALTAEAAPQQAVRETLQIQTERMIRLHEVAGDQLQAVKALALVTEALPETAWINLMRVEGGKMFISGFANDAATLVQDLSKRSGVHGARLSSPAVRHGNSTQESFTIELQFDAALDRLAPASAGQGETS